ncbi:hypothetical protein BDR05DRAFT_994023 [Suillus weaverae]|nr:hypothetical protein BDR05DRAFT_994023 [Suillus weaverae]
MPLVSDDPTWWPTIDASIVSSYFIVAASVAVGYDWALTLTQEVELIWRQRWSLITALYLCLRYVGLVYAVISILAQVPTIPLTDTRSRKVLIPLVVTFLALSIINGTIAGIVTKNSSAVVLILSGSYVCSPSFDGIGVLLVDITWIISIVWEVLALCLACWIAVNRIRELRRSAGGGILGGCFMVLIKTHVAYFVSFLAVSCFQIGYLSPTLSTNPYSLETQMYLGFSQIFTLVQMVVLGPRLILSVREFNAELVADSDIKTAMTSVAFQQHVHITTGSGV